jgi:hypothetical protein
MKKSGFDLFKGKISERQKKEINLSFTQYQTQNNNILNNISNKNKIDTKNNDYNVDYADIEKEVYVIGNQNLDIQINSLKKMLFLKDNLIEKLKKNKLKKSNNKNNSSNGFYEQKKNLENSITEMKINYNNIETKLKTELSYVQKVQNEIEDFIMRKYQLKRQIDKYKKLIPQIQINKRMNTKTKISLNNNFNRINTNEISKGYEGIMTTTGNELCKSRLGNKLLLSLNVGEINKNVNFNKYSLAYPVLKKKKIQFNLNNMNEEKVNGKNMFGKKKISLDNYNNFDNANEFIDGSKTVF